MYIIMNDEHLVFSSLFLNLNQIDGIVLKIDGHMISDSFTFAASKKKRRKRRQFSYGKLARQDSDTFSFLSFCENVKIMMF